ncbi:hypothetical protein EJ07DRAFT_174501 [Lizonia empirigonia]|nr:hypothetical protein EJ07DRAFT_174501 [Lizonia empirigonia]
MAGVRKTPSETARNRIHALAPKAEHHGPAEAAAQAQIQARSRQLGSRIIGLRHGNRVQRAPQHNLDEHARRQLAPAAPAAADPRVAHALRLPGQHAVRREQEPGDSGVSAGGLDKRPEKTTAVAGRLIAGALGVRAPKRTDEEREYDRVVREKERKRRAEEREREKREAEEREARKKAVWDE